MKILLVILIVVLVLLAYTYVHVLFDQVKESRPPAKPNMRQAAELIITGRQGKGGKHNNPTQQHAKRKGNKLNLKAKAKRKRIKKGR